MGIVTGVQVDICSGRLAVFNSQSQVPLSRLISQYWLDGNHTGTDRVSLVCGILCC